MALLDAIVCVSDGTNNCYSNLSARSIGIGMVNGTLINWNGTRWHQTSNTEQILINDQNSVITELWTTDQMWAIVAAPTITGKALNGLYYDGCNAGIRNFTTSLAYCASKGMRLPTLDETGAKSSSNVPSCSWWTWTSTDYATQDSYGYNMWLGASTDFESVGAGLYVRCVK